MLLIQVSEPSRLLVSFQAFRNQTLVRPVRPFRLQFDAGVHLIPALCAPRAGVRKYSWSAFQRV